MPGLVVHNRMGDRVIAQLDPEISAVIDRDIFRFAVMGSDPYLFYRFFFRKIRRRVCVRQAAMHKTKTGLFLTELAKVSQSDRMFSALAGFLCHYSLDSTTHPYVNAKARKRPGYHTAIEVKLENMELSRQGKQRKEIMDLFAFYPELPELEQVIKKVYGWDDVLLGESYRWMKLYHLIVKDQHGILNALLGRRGGKYAALSYANHMCDDMDLSGFASLEDEAVDMGVRLITAAYNYRSGFIREDELRAVIGNRSHSGGEAKG